MRLPLPMMLVLGLLLSARWARAHQQASPAGGPDLDEIDHDFSDEIDPTGVSPYLNMLPAEAGRDRHAIRTVKPKRVPVRPKGKLEWVKLRAIARKYVKETNLELAKAQYETILQTKVSGLPARTVASLHIELGRVHVKLGNEDLARYHYQEAQAFIPQHAQPYVRMAQLATQIGSFDEAVEHYKHALFFNNSHTLALHNLGSLLFAQCKIEEASFYFSAALGRRGDRRSVLLQTSPGSEQEVGREHEGEHSRGHFEADESRGEEFGGSVGSAPTVIATTSNMQLFLWLTDHIFGIISANEDPIFDERTAEKFASIYALSNAEKRWVVGHVLDNLAQILIQMGLFDEAMQAWHLMHYERLMGTSSVFLPRYATALPKILEHASGRRDGWTEIEAIQAMRSRMAWAWDEIHRDASAGGTGSAGAGRFAVLDSLKRVPAYERWPLAEINPVGASLLALRHHLTSDSLLEHRERKKRNIARAAAKKKAGAEYGDHTSLGRERPTHHPFASSESLMDLHRVSAESIGQWSRNVIQGLHASSSVLLTLRSSLRKYENGGMPADPSRELVGDPESLSQTRRALRRLAGKERIKRKRLRRNSKKERMASKRAGKGRHVAVRDARVEKFNQRLKNELKEEKERRAKVPGGFPRGGGRAASSLMGATHLLPPIRVGFFCEALTPLTKDASSSAVHLVRRLIQRTVLDAHVTLFIPPWTNQQIANPEGQAFRKMMISLADDFASVSTLQSTTVHNLANFHASLSDAFSSLAIEGDRTSRSLPRVDVLVFVGATTGRSANFLAHSRLAPVQIAYWSGAGTTGLGGATLPDRTSTQSLPHKDAAHGTFTNPNPPSLYPAGAVDYFVAPEIILEREAQRAYSEQLVRLPGAGAILPVEIEDLPTSAKAGSSPQYKFKKGTLYLYAKYVYAVVLHDSLSQIHPKFDSVIADVLARVPNVQILLVNRRDRDWENTMGYGRLVRRIRGYVQQSYAEARTLRNHNRRRRLREEEEEDEDGEESQASWEQEVWEREQDGDSQTEDVEAFDESIAAPRQEEDGRGEQGKLDHQRVRHVMGLSRAEYLSLIAAVDLVLDPVTEDGGGLETALVPTLEALMIGTPVVTLRPDEDVRGWDRMQPTSSAAGVIQAVGGDAMASRCVARTPQAYAVLAAALLVPENRSAHVAMCVQSRALTREWLEEQNTAVGTAWINFLQRVGRPYADWRGRVKLEVAAEEKEKKKKKKKKT